MGTVGIAINFVSEARPKHNPALNMLCLSWGSIRKYIDEMLVVFPFEVEFYKKYDIKTEYLGHPIVDHYYNEVNPKEITESENKILGILPGSRRQELEKLLPDMIITAHDRPPRGYAADPHNG